MAGDIKSAIKYAQENPDSTFATELRRRIETGMVDKELSAAGLKPSKEPEKGSGFKMALKDIPSDIKEGAAGVKGAIKSGMDKASEAADEVIEGKVSPVAGTVKTIGAGLSAGARAIGEGIKTVGKFFVSPKTEEKAAELVEAGAEKVAGLEPVQALMQKYEALSPEDKALVDGALGAAEGLGAFLGLGAGSRAVKQGAEAVVEAGAAGATKAATAAANAASTAKTAVAGAAKDAAATVKAGTEGVADIIKGARDITKSAGESMSRIPSNIKTNLEQKAITRAAIEKLPTETAKLAAQDGIEVPDIETVLKLAPAPAAQKSVAKELVSSVKKFAAGDTSTNPIEVVGRPIVARLKSLDQARQKAGIALGEAARNLGNVSREELMTPVFNAIKSVPGLSGLELGKGGILNFKGTTLATEFTKADRSAIQKAFIAATKPGAGVSKHKLRQELFEVLGAAKKAGKELTDTQAKALDAIRAGLSDVLETKNARYKTLSNQYRKIIQPLQAMRNVMKVYADADGDILDMKAGLLARRITSNAVSNPEIRNILRAMDEATGVKGKTAVSVENLQDLYNVLDKYFDIAAKTGFKGQVKSAMDGASGVGDFITKQVSGVAGETAAVRQKAIDKLLSELLGS